MKPKPSSQAWKIVLGLAVSMLFLGLALYHVDFHKLLQTFTRIRAGWLWGACFFILGAFFFRSLLWRQLLRNSCPPRIWNFYRIITIGYLGNNLLPLKLGEVLRAWLLSRHEKIPTSVAFATVVLERGIDLLALITYFVLMMFLVPFAPWLKLSGLLLAGFGLVFFLAVAANYRFGGHMVSALEKPLSWLPGKTGVWLHHQLDKFLDGLKLITSLRQFLLAVLVALLSWLCWIMVTYFCFQAAGLHLPFAASAFMIVVLNFGLMIPSSPGGLGVFEFMVILALGQYGVEKEAALGVGFLYHMVIYLFILVIGWIFAVQMNVSMFKIPQAAGEAEGGE